MNGESNGGLGADASSCSAAGSDGPWDEWDEPEARLPDEHVWDAFELDDTVEDPEPEYGDFWLEADDEEEVDQ